MTSSSLARVVAASVCFVASAGLAKDDARQEQLRRMSPDRVDPRCAAEGPGFVYVPEARSCVRLGGLVGVQGSGSTSR